MPTLPLAAHLSLPTQPTYLCPPDLDLEELCSVLPAAPDPGAHPLQGMVRLMLNGTVSKKELVLAERVHARDAAKDTQHPDPGDTERAWNLAVGRGQGTLTCGCAAMPLP